MSYNNGVLNLVLKHVKTRWMSLAQSAAVTADHEDAVVRHQSTPKSTPEVHALTDGVDSVADNDSELSWNKYAEAIVEPSSSAHQDVHQQGDLESSEEPMLGDGAASTDASYGSKPHFLTGTEHRTP